MNNSITDRLVEINTEVNSFLDAYALEVSSLNTNVSNSGWSRELKLFAINSTIGKINFIKDKLNNIQQADFQNGLARLGIEVQNVSLKIEELLVKMLADSAAELYQIAQVISPQSSVGS